MVLLYINDICINCSPKSSYCTHFSTPDPYQKVVRISYDGKFLISGGEDGILRVWSFPELNPIHEIEAHEKEIDDIEFSPDNTKVSSAGAFKPSKILILYMINGWI